MSNKSGKDSIDHTIHVSYIFTIHLLTNMAIPYDRWDWYIYQHLFDFYGFHMFSCREISLSQAGEPLNLPKLRISTDGGRASKVMGLGKGGGSGFRYGHGMPWFGYEFVKKIWGGIW